MTGTGREHYCVWLGLPAAVAARAGLRQARTDDVDDAEQQAVVALHGEHGAVRLVELNGHDAVHDVQVIPHALGAAQHGVGGVDLEHEGAEGDVDDGNVRPGGHEGGHEAALGGVQGHAEGDKEGRRGEVDARQGVDDSGAAEDEHAGDDDVGDKHEAGEHNVWPRSPAGVDDLQGGVNGGTLALDLDGKDGEEEHLDGGAAGVPEGARHTVVVSNIGGLQQRGCPGPLGHDVAGSQADLDGAASGGELLAGLVVAGVAVTQVHQQRGEQGEHAAETADDEPAQTLGQSKLCVCTSRGQRRVSDPGLKVAQGRGPLALRDCACVVRTWPSKKAHLWVVTAQRRCVSVRVECRSRSDCRLQWLDVHMSTGSAPRALRAAPPASALLSPAPRSVCTLLCPQRGGDARAGGPEAVFWRHVTPVPG